MDSENERVSERSRLRIGCAGLPPRMSRERYFDDLRFLETDATFASMPKLSVLRKWRREAPAGAGFALVAPRVITHRPGPKGYPGDREPLEPARRAEAGDFRDSALVREAVAQLAAAAEALEAEAVVFRTPAGFAPSAKNRDAMRRFFEELAPAGSLGPAVRVWEPQGLWEPAEAVRHAGDLDVVLGCDPLARDPLGDQAEALMSELPRDHGYFRPAGLGSSSRQFEGDDLAELLEFAADFDRAWIAFDNVAKFSDARRLTRAIAEASGADPES